MAASALAAEGWLTDLPAALQQAELEEKPTAYIAEIKENRLKGLLLEFFAVRLA